MRVVALALVDHCVALEDRPAGPVQRLEHEHAGGEHGDPGDALAGAVDVAEELAAEPTGDAVLPAEDLLVAALALQPGAGGRGRVVPQGARDAPGPSASARKLTIHGLRIGGPPVRL